jgi:hypothetical protein
LRPSSPSDPSRNCADFAAALADQSKDCDVSSGVARHHADERAFAHAAAAENSHALPAATSQKCIDRANPTSDSIVNWSPVQWQRSPPVEFAKLPSSVRIERVEWIPFPVDDTPKERVTDSHGRPSAPGDNAIAIAQTIGAIEWHGEHDRTAESHHLARKNPSASIDQVAQFADTTERTLRFDHLADHLGRSRGSREWLAVPPDLVSSLRR